MTVRARDSVANFTANEDNAVGIAYYRTLGLNGYNMISVPGETGTGTTAVSSVAGDDLSYLRVLGWNGRYTLGTTFDEGQGYWILNRSGSTSTRLDIDGAGGECMDYSCYTAQGAAVTRTVGKGWNLLGNPCLTNITGANIQVGLSDSTSEAFATAVTNGYVRNTVYRWNGANYTTDAPVLTVGENAEPWKGYWFYVNNTTPYATDITITCGAQ